MAQFNAFEEAIDFSFWKELCEKHGKPQHFRRGEYFVRTGEVLKNVVLSAIKSDYLDFIVSTPNFTPKSCKVGCFYIFLTM